MLKCLKNADWKKTGIFAAGVAFGTAGMKIFCKVQAQKESQWKNQTVI